MSKYGISIKLSSDPSSKAQITKLFIVKASLQNTWAIYKRALKSGNILSTQTQDCRMGTSKQIRLQILKIQMNLILVPLLKTSSSGIFPMRQCLYRSSFIDSFMKQLQRGMRIYTKIYSQTLFLLSSCRSDLGFSALVKSLIFLLTKMSDKSYLVYLKIQIHTVSIFSFFSVFPFSSKSFSKFLIKSYSKLRLRKSLYSYIDFYMKGVFREFYSILVCLIYLTSLSYLNRFPIIFQNFICYLIIFIMVLNQSILTIASGHIGIQIERLIISLMDKFYF